MEHRAPAAALRLHLPRPDVGLRVQAMVHVQRMNVNAGSGGRAHRGMQQGGGVAATTGRDGDVGALWFQRAVVSLKRP
jgi:hypothetical protein